MYGIIRSESCPLVENLVTSQTVWQTATYQVYAPKKSNSRKLYATDDNTRTTIPAHGSLRRRLVICESNEPEI